MTWFRRLAVSLFFVAALSAGTVTYTYTYYGISPNAQGFCNPNSFNQCLTEFGEIQQFNPELGTLDAIRWSFTDTQYVQAGISNAYGPVGVPNTLEFTSTDASTVLGMNASTTSPTRGTADRRV